MSKNIQKTLVFGREVADNEASKVNVSSQTVNHKLGGKIVTKTQTIAVLAEKTEMSKAQVGRVLEELSNLAYREAKNTFVIPGIGKLVLVNRKARLGRNPATGASIQIPAKTVVKFRVAKVCKMAVLGK